MAGWQFQVIFMSKHTWGILGMIVCLIDEPLLGMGQLTTNQMKTSIL